MTLTEPVRLMDNLVLDLSHLLSLTRRQKKKSLVCPQSQRPPPTALPLPEASREAPHVLRHPAVLHRRQLRLPRRLLQVSRSRPPPVRVGAALAGSPVSLDAGVPCVLKGESGEVEVEVGDLLLMSVACWVAQLHPRAALSSITMRLIIKFFPFLRF